jgi:hypothetical protein
MRANRAGLKKMERMLIAHQLKPAIVPALAILTFMLVLVLPDMRSALDNYDRPYMRAIATVTAIYHEGSIDDAPPDIVVLDVDGRVTSVRSRSPLSVGDHLEVEFTIGRNGAVYVTWFSPKPQNVAAKRS